MIITNVKNSNGEQNLIVGCNIFNNDDMKSVVVPGMDYTLNIDFDKLTVAYVNNIIERVNVHGEKIVVILNIENKGDFMDAGRKIFKFTNSYSVKKLIYASSLTVYHDSVVKDRLGEFSNNK